MPKQLTRTEYVCIYCDKVFSNQEDAEKHEIKDHDIIWLPIERSDLNRLLNFIAVNPDKNGLLTERLTKTLFKFVKSK